MPSLARSRRSAGRPLLAIALALLVLHLLVEFLFPLVLSLLVGGVAYYLFAPLVDVLERRKVPRLASTGAAVALVLGLLVLAALFLVPRVYGELEELARDLPGYGERLEAWLVDVGAVEEESGTRRSIDRLLERADELALGSLEQVLGALAGVAGPLFALVFGLVIGFCLPIAGHGSARRQAPSSPATCVRACSPPSSSAPRTASRSRCSDSPTPCCSGSWQAF